MRKGGNSSAKSDSGVEGVEVSQGLDHLESQPPLTQPHPPSQQARDHHIIIPTTTSDERGAVEILHEKLQVTSRRLVVTVRRVVIAHFLLSFPHLMEEGNLKP